MYFGGIGLKNDFMGFRVDFNWCRISSTDSMGGGLVLHNHNHITRFIEIWE